MHKHIPHTHTHMALSPCRHAARAEFHFKSGHCLPSTLTLSHCLLFCLSLSLFLHSSGHLYCFAFVVQLPPPNAHTTATQSRFFFPPPPPSFCFSFFPCLFLLSLPHPPFIGFHSLSPICPFPPLLPPPPLFISPFSILPSPLYPLSLLIAHVLYFSALSLSPSLPCLSLSLSLSLSPSQKMSFNSRSSLTRNHCVSPGWRRGWWR